LSQDTFADYTARTSFERPLLSGVAYAQRVMHADREAFERQQGWIIKTMKHEPSPEQDEYAPVIYSQETISYIEGLDMMSGEVCRLRCPPSFRFSLFSLVFGFPLNY
jgi:histidine kinase 2/3/4 (cytokinin receptor)